MQCQRQGADAGGCTQHSNAVPTARMGDQLAATYRLGGSQPHRGAHVSRGQVVGYSGTTGWSTACHLHFTVLLDGSPVNPMNYM